jgi:hypothetical protein
MRERRLILCEGPDDVYFLSGWLETRGATPYPPAAGSSPRRATPPTKIAHGFLLRDEVEVVVQATGGKDAASFAATWAQRAGSAQRNARALLCRDADVPSPDPGPALQSLRSVSRPPDEPTPACAVWHGGDDDPRLPATHTLERLACAALLSAGRDGELEAVRAFIEGGPAGPRQDHKARLYAYYAKYSAIDGRGEFYRQLWTDHGVRTALEAVLEATNTLATLDTFLA